MPVFAVDTHLLLQVIWVSVVAGVGVSALFSLVIVGSVRAEEARRAGERRAAAVYGALAVFAMLLLTAGVLLGVQAMVTN